MEDSERNVNILIQLLQSATTTITTNTTTVTTQTTTTAVSPTATTTLENANDFENENGIGNAIGNGIGSGTIVWAFFNSILLVFILGGNLMTVIAVRTCRRLRAVISNLFILSLAVSDFIVGLTLPYHFAFYLGSHLGESHCYCLLRFFLIIFACCVSTLTLITIAIDRYIAIIYALHYRRYMTRRVACVLITINWTVGAVVATIPMFWNHWNTANHCEFDEVLPSWYMVGFITPGFILIWAVMLLLYWRIMREASKQACQLRNSILYAPAQRRHFFTDWKSIQIVVLIMGCFSLCWLPYFVVACAQIFDVYETSPLLYKSAFSLAMTNSGLNPIIYAWKNTNFRKAFSLLIRCKSPNMHLMYMDGSFCSHYLPRQQSNLSVAIIAPHVSLAAKSDDYEHNSHSDNNNNLNNNNDGVQTTDFSCIGNVTPPISGASATHSTLQIDHHVGFATVETETDIQSHNSTTSAGSFSTTTTATKTNGHQCAACRVCKSILLKSIQFGQLFTQRNMTNKMLM